MVTLAIILAVTPMAGVADDFQALRKSDDHLPALFREPFNRKLLESLIRKTNTWTIVVYEEDQSPFEYIDAFFWEVNNMEPEEVPEGLKKVYAELKKTEAILNFEGKALLRHRDPIERVFKNILSVVNGTTHATLILKNFPDPVSAESLVIDKTMRTFVDVFGSAIKEGTIRIIMTIQKGIYYELLKDHPKFFDRATVIVLPKKE